MAQRGERIKRRVQQVDGEAAVRVPRLLTAKQLVEQTGLAQWMVYEMVRLDEDERAGGKRAERAKKKRERSPRPLPPPPPYLWVGRKLWFPEAGVAQWVEQQTAKPKESK